MSNSQKVKFCGKQAANSGLDIQKGQPTASVVAFLNGKSTLF